MIEESVLYRSPATGAVWHDEGGVHMDAGLVVEYGMNLRRQRWFSSLESAARWNPDGRELPYIFETARLEIVELSPDGLRGYGVWMRVREETEASVDIDALQVIVQRAARGVAGIADLEAQDTVLSGHQRLGDPGRLGGAGTVVEVDPFGDGTVSVTRREDLILRVGGATVFAHRPGADLVAGFDGAAAIADARTGENPDGSTGAAQWSAWFLEALAERGIHAVETALWEQIRPARVGLGGPVGVPAPVGHR